MWPQSSLSKKSLWKKPARIKQQTQLGSAAFMLDLFFNSDDGGYMFF
jgi:hypothetical protein